MFLCPFIRFFQTEHLGLDLVESLLELAVEALSLKQDSIINQSYT